MTDPGEVEASETGLWGKSDSFAPTLLGNVYRLHASAPDFKAPQACWAAGEGVSLLLFPDGSGHMIVSKRKGVPGSVRHATIPLKLGGENFAAQRCISVELMQFKDRCVLHGDASPGSSNEACTMVNDFGTDILTDDDCDDWSLKLYPSLGGHSFHYDDAEDGEGERTLATDIIMTTPNCDELGHYLFRKTGAAVSSDMLEAAVAGEVAAWDASLNVPRLSVGDRVRLKGRVQSANEDGGILDIGLSGTVTQLDEDGDAEIDFGPEKGQHFILARAFPSLTIV